jgi:hypothetical protein
VKEQLGHGSIQITVDTYTDFCSMDVEIPRRENPRSVPLAVRIADLESELRRLTLTALATSVHGCAFSARELLDHARDDADLRSVLGDARTPKSVGRRLLAWSRYDGDGLRLVRVDRNEDGCIWTVEIQDDAGIPPAARV